MCFCSDRLLEDDFCCTCTSVNDVSHTDFISYRCTCYSPIICTCEDSDSISDEMLEDMVSSLTNIIKNQDKIIISGTSVKEASDIRTKFGSSVTVTVTNFSKTLLSAVRTSTMAGEIEVPQCDVAPLGREALLCKRITKPSSKDGCAGTANYKINGTNEHLHIMWSSPNNFDKHACRNCLERTAGTANYKINGFNFIICSP